MNTGANLRCAALGLGWVTQHRHIPSLQRTAGMTLVGVVDRHNGLAQKLAGATAAPYWAQTDDLAQVPWLDQIDAVTIGTAPMAHHRLATQALALGKHVLCEKPFAMSVAEGEDMLRVAQQNGRILAVVHNFQFSRAMTKLDRDLAQGRLGGLRRVAAVQTGNPRRRLPSWYQQLPFGLFYDESPHFFYLLRRLAGAPLRLVQAHAQQGSMKNATPAAVSLTYRARQADGGDLPLTIDCLFESPVSEWHVAVFGDDAVGVVDVFRDIYLRLPNDGAHGLLSVLRTSGLAMLQHGVQHVPNGIAYLRKRLDYGNDTVFAGFARAAQTRSTPFGINAHDALDVLRLQHEAITAARANMV